MNAQNQAIKSTMMSGGWKDIRNLLEGKINGLKLPENISKNMSYNDIAIHTLGKAYARKTIKRWLKELDKISNEKEWEKPKLLR
jgi:hypothetical protein